MLTSYKSSLVSPRKPYKNRLIFTCIIELFLLNCPRLDLHGVWSKILILTYKMIIFPKSESENLFKSVPGKILEILSKNARLSCNLYVNCSLYSFFFLVSDNEHTKKTRTCHSSQVHSRLCPSLEFCFHNNFTYFSWHSLYSLLFAELHSKFDSTSDLL